MQIALAGNTGSRSVAAVHNGCCIGDSESSCITDSYEQSARNRNYRHNYRRLRLTTLRRFAIDFSSIVDLEFRNRVDAVSNMILLTPYSLEGFAIAIV